MAPWIALELTVFDQRKTLGLAIRLGLRETHLVGHLARLWTWALSSAPRIRKRRGNGSSASGRRRAGRALEGTVWTTSGRGQALSRLALRTVMRTFMGE